MSAPDSGANSRTSASGAQSSGRALVQLALIALLAVVAAYATNTTDLLIVIVAIVVMVMLHELGHFATAKWSHMKVTEYFLGFGPRLWSIRKGETEYGVKAIPAGGYVRIIGMNNLERVDPKDEPRAYRQQPFLNRLLVAVSGSAMHAVMALVLLWALFALVGTPSSSSLEVMRLVPFSNGFDPARTAGLHVGDVISGYEGRVFRSPDALVRAIASHEAMPLRLSVERGSSSTTLTVTPQRPAPDAKARIGVELGPVIVRSNAGSSVARAFEGLGRTASSSLSALGQIFSPHGISTYLHELQSSQAAKQASQNGTRIQSIYGAVRTAAQGARAGAGQLVEVLVSINVFVGILNLFPMLPLDGGHVAIAVYERIRSGRGRMYHADVAKLLPVAYAFVGFLGFIVVSSLYLDITHPIANPFQ